MSLPPPLPWMAFLSPTRAQRNCHNSHDLSEGLRYLRDSSLGTAEATDGSLFLITGREHCCSPAQSRQFYKAGVCRWLCRGAALEEESLPHSHISLLPLFPPLKRLEEIIAEDLCAILRILFGCELLNNRSTGETRQNFLALVIKEKHVSIVWGQRMYQI